LVIFQAQGYTDDLPSGAFCPVRVLPFTRWVTLVETPNPYLYDN